MNLEEVAFQAKPFYQLIEDLGDSSEVFSQEYKEFYYNNFPTVWNCMPISVILRRFGMEFKNDFGEKLKILQLGCGPNYGYDSGPKLDQILTQFGVKVLNLDIEKSAEEYYSQGSFIHGSCLELDKYFSDFEFDVIFMDQMDPFLDEQIREEIKEDDLSSKYLTFVDNIMDKVKSQGMFFISNAGNCSFRIGDNENLKIKKKYKYSYFQESLLIGGLGLQVYEKALI